MLPASTTWRNRLRSIRSNRMLTSPFAKANYANVQWFFGSFIGRLVLFGFTWGLIHHTLGGIRHLIWDTGHGLDTHQVQWLARATVMGSIMLTLIVWVVGYLAMGGAR